MGRRCPVSVPGAIIGRAKSGASGGGRKFAGLAWLAWRAYAGEQQPGWLGCILLIVLGLLPRRFQLAVGLLWASFLMKVMRGSPDASPDF